MNLSSIDLNLFVVLHAVLEEKSATRAAKKLRVTQSAVSNALARLRSALGDPLVVRSGRGLVPTPRAEELAPVIAQAIERLGSAIERGKGFSPKDTTRTFTIGAADNHQVREVPRIAEAFAKEMPRAKLRSVSADFLTATDGLATGEVDVAFVPTMALPPGQRGAHAFDETPAFVVRRDHPVLGRRGARLTPKIFGALPHVDIEVALGRRGHGGKMAELWLKRVGLERNVVFTAPYFTTAAMIASRTDAIAGIPGRVAAVLCESLPIKRVPTSFQVPCMGISLVWHERTDGDDGARFFRALVLEAVR